MSHFYCFIKNLQMIRKSKQFCKYSPCLSATLVKNFSAYIPHIEYLEEKSHVAQLIMRNIVSTRTFKEIRDQSLT